MKYFLLFLAFLSIQTFAADDGDWWLQRQITLQQNREDYARRVYGSARHTYDVVDPKTSKATTITKTVIIEDVPSKARVGKVLLERAKKYRGGIAGVLGGAAVTGLIEAVGWVMEEGTFVKYKKGDEDVPPNEYQYLYGFLSADKQPCWCDTASEAGKTVSLASTEDVKYVYKSVKDLGNKNYSVVFDVVYPKNPVSNQKNVERTLSKRINPNGIPDPKPKKITITPEDVGGIVTGDYKDPVDSKHDITDQQYRQVITDAYQHDPTGTGEEIANEVDDRIKNAPPTPDGKPAPIGDPKYKNPPSADGATNDRSWGDDSGKADGDTTPKTDPTTGQPTGGQSISLQFPVFCEWAHTMCKWYDDWKVSDKRDQKFQEDFKKHNDEEKTFWTKVTDFFDWVKEEPEKDDDQEQPDIDDKGIFSKTFDYVFSLSKQCPPDIPFTFESTYISGSFTINMSWLCMIFTFLGYPLVFASHATGIWILYEAVIRKEFKW